MNICLCFILKVWHSTGVPSLVGPQPMALAIGRFVSRCTWQESHGPCFTTPSTHIRWGHKRVISPFSSSNLIEKSRTLYWKGTFRALPPSWGHLMFFELARWPSKVRFENSKTKGYYQVLKLYLQTLLWQRKISEVTGPYPTTFRTNTMTLL